MPDVDDSIGRSACQGNGKDAEDCANFEPTKWDPEKCEYGVLNLLISRGALPDGMDPPDEVHNLKCVDVRIALAALKVVKAPVVVSVGGAGRAEGREAREVNDDDPRAPEGVPHEQTESVAWPGKAGSWWRVRSDLGEDVIVREGVSLQSTELGRIAPADLLQQAGPARTFARGRAKGCVRVPVRPEGWVTADATRAGGPKYITRASAPRWRVVYQSPNSSDGDVIVREAQALESDEVAVLWCGDIVEQAGPLKQFSKGIMRMPVTEAVGRRRNDDSDKDGEKAWPQIGWVTVDATPAGGPIFFKVITNPHNGQDSRHANHANQGHHHPTGSTGGQVSGSGAGANTNNRRRRQPRNGSAE